ncbi:MAG: DUF2939 domain-containing protein [Hyphomicrobiaceae bacterium]|nr:DUF2939 domain-containing protein [Hyphomicrobiaceae bacterium]
MRGKLVVFLTGLLALAAYVAAPFHTAWSIREAVRNGDAAYLEARIDWPRVKQSLKTSMADYALAPVPSVALGEPEAARPGLWQRIKAAAGRRLVASMVDNLATPAGLSRLFSYRKTYNEKVRGLPDERLTLTLRERISRAWDRVTRAEFLTPSRFAMEMRDKVVPDRRYAGILELQAGTWRLVHLEVKRDENTGQDLTSRITSASAASGVWQAMKQASLP